MHLFVSARALLRPFLAVLVATAGVAAAGAQAASTVVISEIYGGGGNAGATYTNDFIELFNPTSAPQSLSQYSVQYASSTGTSYQVAPLPSVTLQPGQFFLLQAAAGAGGTTSLPSPDAISSLSLSATTGKIALVNNTTALSGTAGCPTMDASLLDFVGFGSGANCFLGTGSTPTLSNTTAAIRTNLCVNAKNNSSEFTAQPALPHNTASTPQPCTGAGAAITATAQATPASVFAGSQTLLTVSVNPATNPPSTNLQVTANLSAIGGYSSQPFFDDGSHGDVTAGDNVYSYATSPSTNGSYTLPVSVQDAQLRTATATVSLTVQTPPTVVSIRAIQAAKPSPYAGQTVTTSGIVVGVRASGIYLEARDADNNPTTPEGLYIYTGSSAKPSYIAVGAEIQVSGKVANYPPTSPTPDTEIDGPQTFTFLSANNPLPAAIKITAAQDNPSGSVYQFAKYEGMRVAIDSLTSTSGTGASLNEQTETQTSNGQFYGVVTGIARPFREPGISVTDIVYGSIPSGVPVWDSNPELLLVDSRSLGGPAVNLTSNTTVTGLSGVMDFSSGAPSILLDATDHPGISSGPGPRALPLKAANEFTVASFNMERFYNDQVDADNPGSSVVVVTPEAYQRRLNKASLAIRTILNNPDLIGAQEIENLNVLNDLANKINADTTASGQANPQYQAYLFLANDGTGINTGVLAKGATVTALKAEQIGLNATFTNAQGNQAILNDRTPLVLHAGIKRPGAADFPVTLIDVHQRSLINVDDPTNTGATVRLKREAQAEYLARLIQSYQAAGEHVITVGDFNAFQFSDGFVDVLGVSKGNPVPASQVVTPPVANLVSPSLTDLVTLLPPDQQQSYVETGSAQVLDHVLVTQDLLSSFDHLYYAHIDSDFPLVAENDTALPARISDHDPALAYFSVPTVPASVTLQTQVTLGKNGSGYTETLTVTNKGTATATTVLLNSATLGSATGAPLPASLGDLAPGASVTVVLSFPATAGPDSAATVVKVAGTYAGGSFGSTQRAFLP